MEIIKTFLLNYWTSLSMNQQTCLIFLGILTISLPVSIIVFYIYDMIKSLIKKNPKNRIRRIY